MFYKFLDGITGLDGFGLRGLCVRDLSSTDGRSNANAQNCEINKLLFQNNIVFIYWQNILGNRQDAKLGGKPTFHIKIRLRKYARNAHFKHRFTRYQARIFTGKWAMLFCMTKI